MGSVLSFLHVEALRAVLHKHAHACMQYGRLQDTCTMHFIYTYFAVWVSGPLAYLLTRTAA